VGSGNVRVMADQPTVVVRGEAHREVPPEQAVFAVTATARDKDQQAVLARLTERAAALRRVLDDHPDAIERRETAGMQVYPQLKRGGERISAYTGSVTTTVTVTDFSVLGELLLRLAAEELTSVAGPWWQLRPGSTAGAEVRRAAIADALSRAREYADAVGSRLDRLVEISDEGTGGDRSMAMRSMAFDVGGAVPPLELELDPQQQTVHASVIVRVAITEPTGLK
jgi:uncharacterized protein